MVMVRRVTKLEVPLLNLPSPYFAFRPTELPFES